MKKLTLSVTEFAIPSPLLGSIETYSGFGNLPEVGSQIHLDIQAERAREFPEFVPEKWITHDFSFDEHTISVTGRMDGFCEYPEPWIEEIKSAYDIDRLREKLASELDHPYKRQLQTYGYLHWLQTRTLAHLRFCLVNSRDNSQEFMDVPLVIEEYEQWLKRRLQDIVDYEKLFESARKRRKKNAKIELPFEEERPGQMELIRSIETKIKNESRMMIQAPTGMGKTMGVMLPVLQNSLSRGQKLIYLTAKNSQHSVAEDAVDRLQEAGANIRSLSLHAKKKMCFKEEVMCDPTYCEFAKDHYTKMGERKVAEQLFKKRSLTEATIKKIAAENEVCPFELQMDSAAFTDVVIGDYNYIFSTHNVRDRLTRNSLGKSASLANLVIDEAHNLPMRAMDYFSVEFNDSAIQDLIYRLQNGFEFLLDRARDLEELMHKLFAKVSVSVDGKSPAVVKLTVDDMAPLLEVVQKLLAEYLQSDATLMRDDPVVQVYNIIAQFTDVLDKMREEFVCIYEAKRNGSYSIKVVCCDASWWLKEAYADFSSVVAFSATLKPFTYYRELLGLEAHTTDCDEFTSPFPKENRKILIIPQVSTKWRDRDSNIGRIVEAVTRIVEMQRGNYFVFFPSFDFLDKTAAHLDLPESRVILQRRNMTKAEIEDVLTQLKEGDRPTVVLAVQGGIFSEGVDYPGDMLIGAIIVGPALPVFNFEREQLREYYEKKFGSGFDYAYTFPAMARTIQSAGRVIRSSTDRGLIVLMDRRFLDRQYVDAMPLDWVENGASVLASKQILNDIEEFWKPHELE